MDFIIISILVIFVVYGIVYTRKHMKGVGGCCGGSETPTIVEKKVLNNVIGKKIAIIEGMHCNHCKGWVEKAINSIDGASCEVNLVKKEAVILLEKEIEDKEIYAAVVKAGYKVREIY